MNVSYFFSTFTAFSSTRHEPLPLQEPSMIPKGLNRRWCCLALAGLALGAQPAPQDLVLDLMTAKLAAAYALGRGPGQGGPLLLLTPLGLPLTADQLRDPYELSMLLDRMPQGTSQYYTGARTFSSVYGTILRHAEVARFQKQADLNPLREARNLLRDRRRPGKPSAAFAAYLTYQHAHTLALDAQTLARVEHQTSGRPVPAGLDAAEAQALRNWTDLGHKHAIEAACRTIEAACASNPRVLFEDLASGLHAAAIRDGHATPWYPVEANPPMAEWFAGPGWQNWHFRKDDLRAEAPGGPGPQGASAPIPPQQAAWQADLVMDAQLKRVTIARPWLDLNIFRSHAWRPGPAAGPAVVATGRPSDPEPGSMPLVVTGLLLARNLVVSGTWPEPAGAAEAPKAIGPFALASPAPTRSLPLKPFLSPFEGRLGIRVEGTQIIGFFCESVPKAPSPDPKLFRQP
jgi:hypothetical protein